MNGKPLLVVNFKSYTSSHGERATIIAKSARQVSEQTGVDIILVPPHTELYRVSKIYAHTYAQPPDRPKAGAYTGSVTIEMLSSAGAKGVLLNHSEKKVPYNILLQMISTAKRHGLKTLVCAETPIEAQAVALTKPDFIAIEPPELIGTGIPVSKARPEIIVNSVKAVASIDPEIPVLAGAGITSGEDAIKAIELGAQGVLVASAVMKSPDPGSKMYELARALALASNQAGEM